MAKAPAASAAPTKKPGTNVISIQAMKDAQRSEVATLKDRLGAPGGDQITITQSKKFKLPNGTEHPGPLQLLIVDFVTAHTFYPGVFDRKNIVPPVCFAIGNKPTQMTPSKNSPEVQAENCQVCPNNQFGSKGDGKACSNTRVLAVLPPDADDDTKLAILKVSATGTKPFDGYVASVGSHFDCPPSGVITEVSFDPDKEYPSLRFGNPIPVTDEQLTQAFTRKAAARDRLMVEPDVSKYVAPAPKKAAGGRR